MLRSVQAVASVSADAAPANKMAAVERLRKVFIDMGFSSGE
jgi:hypothetical protein